MRIVITDSGLGGLSVLAELEKRLKSQPIYENVELIFFNSLYSSEYGYNSVENFSDKVKIFNNALNSIEANYNPDLILIACNTLSVVYPHTLFSQISKTTVKGILESGVTLFKKHLQNENDRIILFGTPTTINSNIYRDELLNAGVKESHIVNQACPDLESDIQRNPKSDKTENSISKFVKEAVESTGFIGDRIYAGFCCTHYGYSEQLLELSLQVKLRESEIKSLSDILMNDNLSKQFKGEVKILNPNSKMLDFLFATPKRLFSNSNLTVRVVTQVKLREPEIESLSDVFMSDSPKTAASIGNYEYIKNLFSKQ